MAGIFGPDAALVRQAIEQQGMAQDTEYANMQPGRGVVKLAAQAGRSFGNAIAGAAGYEDPQVAKAKLLEEAKMEVDSSGADLMTDPTSYYKAAYEALSKRGLQDEAMGVRQIMMQEAVAMANARPDPKGYAASGNMIINKDDGSYSPMEGYIGRSGAKDGTITLSPPGSTQKGTGNEKTVVEGSDEYNQFLKDGWIDTSKIPGPERSGQNITVKAEFEQKKDRGDLAKEEMRDIRVKGSNADALRRQTGLLKNKLESTSFDPGTLSGFRETVASAAQYFGVSDETLAAFRQNPNDANILGSVTNNMVGVMANAMQSGNNQLSASELKLFRESAPNMGQTSQGMYVLNEMIDRYASYEQNLRDYATEQYANIPEDGNDAGVLVNIDRWKRENPFSISKSTLDKLRRHAQLVERGKSAADFAKTPSSKRLEGALYKFNGSLMYYRGINKETGKLRMEPAK